MKISALKGSILGRNQQLKEIPMANTGRYDNLRGMADAVVEAKHPQRWQGGNAHLASKHAIVRAR